MCLPAVAAIGAVQGLTTLQTISLALAAGGGVLAAKSAYDQASAARDAARVNAAVADNNATLARARGEAEAQRIGRDGAATRGAQRAGYSARGIDIADGTAADVIDQTDFFTLADQGQARTNAKRDAWNAEAQRSVYQAEASAARPAQAGFSTLLASAGSVADRWYAYSRPRAGLSYGG